MQTENENYMQDDALTLGDIFNALFCKRIIMLVITFVITVFGVLYISLAIDRPREVYTAEFHLNAINLENAGVYIDGSKFDYRDIISLENLNKAKDSDSKFLKINTNALATGGINIERVEKIETEKNQQDEKVEGKESFYKITLKRTAISDIGLAREYVKSLVNLIVKENITKTETMDYTSNLASYDSSNRYDTQIGYLRNQFNLIISGYDNLISNYGNVISNNKNLTNYSKAVQVYFNDYTFANLESELEQYGYIKDYNQNGRVYYTAVNNNVDSYKVNKLKLQQLIVERDEILDKYANMQSTIENTGLDSIYNQIAELNKSLEDIRHSIRVNLRRVASHYTQDELKEEFAEALSILELNDVSKIYSDNSRGDEETFKANLSRFRDKLTEFTDEFKVVSKDVVSTYSTEYYNNSSVVELSGGLGFVKATLISFVIGFVVACIVNLILGRERLSYEYRLKRKLERAKKYALITDTVVEGSK